MEKRTPDLETAMDKKDMVLGVLFWLALVGVFTLVILAAGEVPGAGTALEAMQG